MGGRPVAGVQPWLLTIYTRTPGPGQSFELWPCLSEVMSVKCNSGGSAEEFPSHIYCVCYNSLRRTLLVILCWLLAGPELPGSRSTEVSVQSAVQPLQVWELEHKYQQLILNVLIDCHMHFCTELIWKNNVPWASY